MGKILSYEMLINACVKNKIEHNITSLTLPQANLDKFR